METFCWVTKRIHSLETGQFVIVNAQGKKKKNTHPLPSPKCKHKKKTFYNHAQQPELKSRFMLLKFWTMTLLMMSFKCGGMLQQPLLNKGIVHLFTQ